MCPWEVAEPPLLLGLVTGGVITGNGFEYGCFGAGCCSGITAGVVNEWTVEGVMDSRKKKKTERRQNTLLPLREAEVKEH